MSIKVSTFTSIINQPLNTHKFNVSIPELDLSMIVESTTFPSEQLEEVQLYYQGESIKYPTIPSQSQSWSITIPEGDNGVVRRQFEELKSKFYSQKTGLLKNNPWKDVVITVLDLQDKEVFKVILHGVWLKGRNDVSLSADSTTTPWKWEYSFVYQWIEDVL